MLMPVVRQGPAPDENRTGGSQPAHQSMSTDVQQARLLPCTTLSTSGAPVDRGWKIVSTPLENGHQSDAAMTALVLS